MAFWYRATGADGVSARTGTKRVSAFAPFGPNGDMRSRRL